MKRKKNTRRPRSNPMKDYRQSARECLEPDKEQRVSRRKSTAANTENEAVRKRHLASIAKEDKGKNLEARGTLVPKWLLRIVENSTEALVIAQLIFWIDRGNRPNPKRGLTLNWVAKKAPDLASELYRKEHEIDSALLRLKNRGFISWVNRKFAGERCRHISIQWEKVEAAYKLAKKKSRPSVHG